MNENPTVKIFVTYKNNYKILSSDILVPIQTGAEISDEKFEGMQGDNTGDNISKLNENICEFSAIYWVWKNYDKIGNPEYVGFVHNRRHLIFNDKNYETSSNGEVEFESINENYLKECGINDDNIIKIVGDYDVIVPHLHVAKDNLYEQFKSSHNIKDLNITLDYIKNTNPEFYNDVTTYLNQKYGYFYNIFILKRKLFFEYCEKVFGILLNINDKIDVSTYDNYQKRALGFIGERLTGAFLYSLTKRKFKVKHLHVSFLRDCKNINAADTPQKKIKWYQKIFSVKNDVCCKKIYFLGFKFYKYKDR